MNVKPFQDASHTLHPCPWTKSLVKTPSRGLKTDTGNKNSIFMFATTNFIGLNIPSQSKGAGNRGGGDIDARCGTMVHDQTTSCHFDCGCRCCNHVKHNRPRPNTTSCPSCGHGGRQGVSVCHGHQNTSVASSYNGQHCCYLRGKNRHAAHSQPSLPRFGYVQRGTCGRGTTAGGKCVDCSGQQHVPLHFRDGLRRVQQLRVLALGGPLSLVHGALTSAPNSCDSTPRDGASF